MFVVLVTKTLSSRVKPHFNSLIKVLNVVLFMWFTQMFVFFVGVSFIRYFNLPEWISFLFMFYTQIFETLKIKKS